MTTIDLNQNAMLVALKVRGWNGRKHDREATDDIHNRNRAARESGKYMKCLIDANALKPIRKLGEEARSTHYNLTMPWDDGSFRLLPVAMYDRYCELLDGFSTRRIAAMKQFIEDYPAHIEAARESLGDLFDADDYPDAAVLERATSMAYQFRTVPDSKHFICEFLSKRDIDRIKRDIDRQVAGQLNHAVQSLYARVGKAVKQFVERFEPTADGKDKIFHATTVDNLRDIIELMPALNITGDKVLSAMIGELETALNGATVEQLRVSSAGFDADKRNTVAANMRRLNSKFSGYFSQAENLSGEIQ